ncbi:hypothetical protein, partial [Saccharopolyspora sp. NPDC002376]
MWTSARNASASFDEAVDRASIWISRCVRCWSSTYPGLPRPLLDRPVLGTWGRECATVLEHCYALSIPAAYGANAGLNLVNHLDATAMQNH